MKFTTLCLAFATALMLSDCVHGQLLKNLFGGAGSTQSEPLNAGASVLGQAGNLLGQQKFQLPSFSSLLDQQGSAGNASQQGPLNNLSKLIPTPKTPSLSNSNLLNQLNNKSKQMIDRTTDWARTKQQSLKEKSFGRLGKSNPLSFFSGSTSTAGDQQSDLAQPPAIPPQKPNYVIPSAAGVPTQPQIRSASNPNGQPTVRF